MNSLIGLKLQELLISWGLSVQFAILTKTIIIVFLIGILAFLSYVVTKRIVFRILHKVVRKTKTQIDDIILQDIVFKRLSHFIPAVIIYSFAKVGLVDYEILSAYIIKASYIYMAFAGIRAIDALINSLHAAYETLPVSKERPIKGYVQSIKILFYAFGVILIISVLIGKSPMVILASMGAIAAILILVFKDTILGFVSGIQLSANKMVKPGDWITMPGKNADGTVLEITLNTVKIQNFDKTIVTVPTYSLISESFQNWEGMESSKGRRIKRSLNIDIKTVKFCDDNMLDRFKKIKLIHNYIEEKQEEIAKYNLEKGTENDKASRRNLTNLGIFRIYIEKYLEQQPNIYPNEPPYTAMVRHMEPTEKGIPIQIYAFSKVQEWVGYEKVQADIFDHVLSVVTEFELSVFQNPTGDDFRKLRN